MDSFEEIKLIKLKDGREIQLMDDDELSIILSVNGQIYSSILLPYPSLGYTGGSIYLSPSESIILFAYYSGQNEEAFTLLKLEDKMGILYESTYLFGEAASYCFTEDETKLIQALPVSCSDWWMPWEDALEHDDMINIEEDDDKEIYFIFGYINVLELVSNELHEHEIRIKPTANWKPEKKDYDPLLLPKDVGKGKLKVSWPWGDEILQLPLPKIIVYRF